MTEEKIIEKKIKQLYGKKETFCIKNNLKFKDLSKKLRTVHNKITWLNSFLYLLGLYVSIEEIEKTDD